MTDLRKAAEMALTALDALYVNDYSGYEISKHESYIVDDAIQALRQALAQEEKQKTPLKALNLTVFTENRLRNGRVYDVETLQAMTNRDILSIPDMGKKALKEVMEALDVYAVNMTQERVDETAKREHEPLVWMNKHGHVASFQNEEYKDPLYTAPPKREWVGLTDEEMRSLKQKSIDDGMTRIVSDFEYIRAIEAKLKEKNG